MSKFLYCIKNVFHLTGYNTDYYLGLRTDETDTWRWISNGRTESARWKVNEPNGQPPSCGRFDSNAGLDDDPCHFLWRFICEVKIV